VIKLADFETVGYDFNSTQTALPGWLRYWVQKYINKLFSFMEH